MAFCPAQRGPCAELAEGSRALDAVTASKASWWTWANPAPSRLLKGAVTPQGRGVPGLLGGTQRLSHLVWGGT